jgi:hypothetical protein
VPGAVFADKLYGFFCLKKTSSTTLTHGNTGIALRTLFNQCYTVVMEKMQSNNFKVGGISFETIVKK